MGDRFLNQNVDALSQKLFSNLRVKDCRSRDADGIDLVEQFRIGCKYFCPKRAGNLSGTSGKGSTTPTRSASGSEAYTWHGVVLKHPLLRPRLEPYPSGPSPIDD